MNARVAVKLHACSLMVGKYVLCYVLGCAQQQQQHQRGKTWKHNPRGRIQAKLTRNNLSMRTLNRIGGFNSRQGRYQNHIATGLWSTVCSERHLPVRPSWCQPPHVWSINLTTMAFVLLFSTSLVWAFRRMSFCLKCIFLPTPKTPNASNTSPCKTITSLILSCDAIQQFFAPFFFHKSPPPLFHAFSQRPAWRKHG